MKIIGISGVSGSGKTTLTKQLQQVFKTIQVIHLDNYYLDRSSIPSEERSNINFDQPEALDIDLLHHHLEQLKQGKSLEGPIYDFKTHTRSSKTIKINPVDKIILEGIFVSTITKIREYIDLLIYIDIPLEHAILRRIERDIQYRGRTLNQVIAQLQETVIPGAHKYIIPSKKYADIIISGEKDYSLIIKLIKKYFND